jgi:hypothetical protein
MAKRSKVSAGPGLGSLELTEEIIRVRAYHFFEERGYEHGHDLEDWLRAETEIMGRKPAESADDPVTVRKAAAA